MRNHSPIKKIARIRAINQKKSSGMSVSMRDVGKNTIYAPRTPEMAPLAPRDGMCEPQEKNTCVSPEPIPQTK